MAKSDAEKCGEILTQYRRKKKNACFVLGRHRWVIYTTEMNGKNTLWEVDGSMVPAEWYDLYFTIEII